MRTLPQTASPSSPSLPSTSHLLSSSINTPVKRYSGFVTGEKRIRLKHSLALVYNLKSSPDKTSKDRGHSLIPLPQRCVHRPMKISQFLMLDTSFLLLSLIPQPFSLLFSQLIVTLYSNILFRISTYTISIHVNIFRRNYYSFISRYRKQKKGMSTISLSFPWSINIISCTRVQQTTRQLFLHSRHL